MKNTPASLSSIVLLILAVNSGLAMTVPIADDAASTTKDTLTLATDRAASLPVNSKQTAFVRFDWLDTNVLPVAFTTQDISSATLRLFIVSAAHPADLTVFAVNSAWNDSTTGNAPQVSSSAVATIPAASVVAGHFVSVDVTAAVIAALQNQTDYGFAIQTASSTAKIVIASKENTAHGYPAELDIEGGVLAGFVGNGLNTAVGAETLLGAFALGADNNTINNDTAIGYQVMTTATAGSFNVAVGNYALMSNSSGNANVAIGVSALTSNISGGGNTAVGWNAGSGLTTGSNNTMIGMSVGGGDGAYNTAVGSGALGMLGAWQSYYPYNGFDNIGIGYLAGFHLTSGSNNIYVGNYGYAAGQSSESSTESNTIRIGYPGAQNQTYIAGISGVTVSGGAPVYALSNGQLGTLNSSRRFKTDIALMGDASKALLALHPVTFRYKPQFDSKGIPQFGLIAEDVEKVCPDLVLRDAKGQIQTVRYEEVNAMLLNEFLKEHQQVEEQGKIIAGYQKRLAIQEERTQALASHLDDVTRQMQRIAHRLDGHDVQTAGGPAPTLTGSGRLANGF